MRPSFMIPDRLNWYENGRLWLLCHNISLQWRCYQHLCTARAKFQYILLFKLWNGTCILSTSSSKAEFFSTWRVTKLFALLQMPLFTANWCSDLTKAWGFFKNLPALKWGLIYFKLFLNPACKYIVTAHSPCWFSVQYSASPSKSGHFNIRSCYAAIQTDFWDRLHLEA